MSKFLLSVLTALCCIQLAHGSSGHLAQELLLKEEIITEVQKKCPESAKPIKIGIHWGWKDMLREARPLLNSDQAQLAPDPNLVEAYAEYFCQTKRVPHQGHLPARNDVLSYLNVPIIDNGLSAQEAQQASDNDSEDNFGDSLSLNSSKVEETTKSITLVSAFLCGAVVGALGMHSYLLRNAFPSNTSVPKLRRPEL